MSDDGLTWVGAPFDVYRAVSAGYLDQARHDFGKYVTRTLAGSQSQGGRFNPPGEFGALYTSTDRDTAWLEIAARYRREGIDGLPATMGMLRIIILEGRYAELLTDAQADLWDTRLVDITIPSPGPAEQQACWTLARSVRAQADALRIRSARRNSENMPLFPDREESQLKMELSSAQPEPPPDDLKQRPDEDW